MENYPREFNNILNKHNRPVSPLTNDHTNQSSDAVHNDALKTKTSRPTRVDFAPAKCIVITDLIPEKAKELNQDIIRRTISEHSGPALTDLIDGYKHNTEKPKYIVQFADPTVIPEILDKGDCNTLHRSSIRKTIAPTPNDHIGVAHGLPLDLSDEDFNAAVQSAYPGCSSYRMRSKSGAPLRTVKLEFSDREELNGAIHTGLHLKAHHLLLRVELPYTNV